MQMQRHGAVSPEVRISSAGRVFRRLQRKSLGWDVLFEDDDTLAAEQFAEDVLFGEVDWESALHGEV